MMKPPLPADIVARVAADFPNESHSALLAMLDEYQGPERTRVIRCVVHLAARNTDKLLDCIKSAMTDYRDVIYWAEYDAGEQKVRDFNQPFATVARGS